ncbi:hypothetical protein D9758_007127 [Tetrapyrgos nigripes]|uniref:Mug135-like C-terminal domain-containing protein n=1 Tax=Tetrapyrgos nigripes TaxID=182062 RepID=A0A8H5GDD4_9AGAR|nr:hypothetical protein D9758_007127 [Tetrapyrgos nigripes]
MANIPPAPPAPPVPPVIPGLPALPGPANPPQWADLAAAEIWRIETINRNDVTPAQFAGVSRYMAELQQLIQPNLPNPPPNPPNPLANNGQQILRQLRAVNNQLTQINQTLNGHTRTLARHSTKLDKLDNIEKNQAQFQQYMLRNENLNCGNNQLVEVPLSIILPNQQYNPWGQQTRGFHGHAAVVLPRLNSWQAIDNLNNNELWQYYRHYGGSLPAPARPQQIQYVKCKVGCWL